MNLIAIHTKSNGWVSQTHKTSKGWLEFRLNKERKIEVSTVKINPLCDGLLATSMFMLYPMDDVIDYIVSN